MLLLLGGDVESNPGPSKEWLKKQAKKQKYVLQREEILEKRRLDYAESSELKRQASKESYEINIEARKSAFKVNYSANSEARKASAKAHYAVNPEAKKAAAKAHYVVNPEAKKAAAKARYVVNPEAKKAAAKARYTINPEAKKAAAKARYTINPEAKKAAAKARYTINPEAKKAAAKASYFSDPEARKSAFKANYLANSEVRKAVAKARYTVNPEAKKAADRKRYKCNSGVRKAVSRANYVKRRWMKIAASKSNYEQKKEHLNIYRRDKYALNEPKAYARQQYVADLQKKLFSKPSLRLELRKDFKQSHENIARKLSKGVLTKTVCRITARRLLDRVVKKRRERVGQLLKCVRVVNSFELSSLNLGERWHTASSEPFFYDTAYMPMNQNNAIPVDEYGRCCTAEEVGDRDKNTMRPKKWKCTEECKLPTDEEISSIVAAKELFKKSMQELRNGLESINKGCQHGQIGALQLNLPVNWMSKSSSMSC